MQVDVGVMRHSGLWGMLLLLRLKYDVRKMELIAPAKTRFSEADFKTR